MSSWFCAKTIAAGQTHPPPSPANHRQFKLLFYGLRFIYIAQCSCIKQTMNSRYDDDGDDTFACRRPAWPVCLPGSSQTILTTHQTSVADIFPGQRVTCVVVHVCGDVQKCALLENGGHTPTLTTHVQLISSRSMTTTPSREPISGPCDELLKRRQLSTEIVLGA